MRPRATRLRVRPAVLRAALKWRRKCGLTIHSSRTRFAARLNSGVRRPHNDAALTVFTKGSSARLLHSPSRRMPGVTNPFGAVLVVSGEIVLTASNTVILENDPTRHAELNLVSQASRTLPRETLRVATLYASTEPCAMCAGAICRVRVPKVVYGGAGAGSSRFNRWRSSSSMSPDSATTPSFGRGLGRSLRKRG